MLPRALIIGPLPPPVGGMAQVAADCLSACNRSRRFEPVSIDVRSGPRRPGRLDLTNLLLHLRLCRILRRECAVPGTALAHLHASVGTELTVQKNLQLARIVKRAGLPLLVQPHSGRMEERLAAARGGSAADRRWRAQLGALLGLAEVVVAMSPGWRELLAREWPGLKLALVMNGVDTDTYAPGPLAERQWRDVVFMGQLAEHKGLGELAEAWRCCGPDAAAARDPLAPSLSVLGEARDPQGALLREALGTLPGVEVLGVVTGGAKIGLLGRSGIFVLPSRYENMPVALLEAMSCGMACIATAVGAVPEILADGAGIIIPPRDVSALADALANLLADAARCAELGALGRQRAVERYGFSAFEQSLLASYEAVKAGVR